MHATPLWEKAVYMKNRKALNEQRPNAKLVERQASGLAALTYSNSPIQNKNIVIKAVWAGRMVKAHRNAIEKRLPY